VKEVGGSIVATGDHRLRFAFDVLSPAGGRVGCTFMATGEGNDRYRNTEHVGMTPRGYRGLRKGKPQVITFPAPADATASTRRVKLKAVSDAGVKVEYYVAYGPADVEGDELRVTRIPARATLSVEVKVLAYHFGSGVAPLVKAAAPVERTLRIR